ncbi:MAG: hypothetical protein R6U58_03265 [Bacteroidales bacterium]
MQPHQQAEIIGTYQDPKEAIREIQNNEPDLLFLDVQMPGIMLTKIYARLEVAGFYHKVLISSKGALFQNDTVQTKNDRFLILIMESGK